MELHNIWRGGASSRPTFITDATCTGICCMPVNKKPYSPLSPSRSGSQWAKIHCLGMHIDHIAAHHIGTTFLNEVPIPIDEH